MAMRGDMLRANSQPSPVRESSSGLTNHRTGRKMPDFEFTDGDWRGKRTDNAKYWMTDKAGHLCRWTEIDKCNTLQATDYKDPPAILTTTQDTESIQNQVQRNA